MKNQHANYLFYLRDAKTIFAIITLFFVFSNTIWSQTTIYSNNFNVSENPLTSAGNPGTPAMIWTTVTTASGYARTAQYASNFLLQINNNSTIGRTYVYGDLSKFSSPFNSTLNLNTSDISWTFNIRPRGSSSLGFGDGLYASAVVLCASSSDFLTANGYAVTAMKGTTYTAIRLVKFAGGLSPSSTITTIIGPSTPESSSAYYDYFSVKVIYSPSTNKWQLFTRMDGTNVSVDPESGTLTQIGAETVDNTFTSTAMKNFGFFFNHGTTTPYQTHFDNFKVVRSTGISWTSGWPKAENPTSNGFKAKVNTNIAGTSYYVVLAKGATAPTSAQVKAGQDAAGAAAIASGFIACASGNTEYTAAVSGPLVSSTPYDVYFVAQDASGNHLQESPVKVTVNIPFSQSVNQFNYQAVLRDSNGNIIASQAKAVVINILQGSATGTSVFTETHNITTTAQGLINLKIGSINTTGIAAIDWATNNYFIRITVGETIMGTSQLLSVPYALTAKTVENVDYSQITGMPIGGLKAGKNVTITGAGTTESPFIINVSNH